MALAHEMDTNIAQTSIYADISNIGHADTELDASQPKEHVIEILENAANETGFSPASVFLSLFLSM